MLEQSSVLSGASTKNWNKSENAVNDQVHDHSLADP